MYKKLYDPIFCIEIKLYKGVPFKKVIPDTEESPMRLGHTRINEETGDTRIWLDDNAGGGTLVHEIYHAVYRHAQKRGIIHADCLGGEVISYLLGYFTNQCKEFFYQIHYPKKSNKKKK